LYISTLANMPRFLSMFNADLIKSWLVFRPRYAIFCLFVINQRTISCADPNNTKPYTRCQYQTGNKSTLFPNISPALTRSRLPLQGPQYTPDITPVSTSLLFNNVTSDNNNCDIPERIYICVHAIKKAVIAANHGFWVLKTGWAVTLCPALVLLLQEKHQPLAHLPQFQLLKT